MDGSIEPGPPRPRRRPGENRERLIVAGISEFAARGYHGASTGAIAELAGVPQPHVYASFANKHALFLACAERAFSSAAREGRGADAEFVLQALAASRDPLLSDPLRALLAVLRTRIGEDAFAKLLSAAAGSILA